MNSSNNFTPAIVCGSLGIGIGLILGLVFGLLIGVYFGKDFADIEDVNDYHEHQNVEVIEFEKRGNEVYLKFRNTGKQPVDDMYFEIEVRGEDNKLRQEYEIQYSKLVPAGGTEETILKPQDLRIEPVDLEGKINVEYKYGWRTASPE